MFRPIGLTLRSAPFKGGFAAFLLMAQPPLLIRGGEFCSTQNLVKETRKRRICGYFLFLTLLRLLSLRHPLLHLAREMRHDTDDAFNQHQLSPMMHLMLLDGHDHVEACSLGRRAALRHLYGLAQEVFRKACEEIGRGLSFGSKQPDDF